MYDKKQLQKEWVWLTSPIVITHNSETNKKTEMKSEEQMPHDLSYA